MAFDPKATTNIKIYNEYIKEFPNILDDMTEFFLGHPNRIIAYHDFNVLFEFLDEVKRTGARGREPFRKIKMFF